MEAFTKQWEDHVCAMKEVDAAKRRATLDKFASTAAAQRAADEATLQRRAKQSEEAAAEKLRLLARLHAEASGSDDGSALESEEEEGPQRTYTADVQRAREEQRLFAAQRREAISRAMEREDRKQAEQGARRSAREQAGHLTSPNKGGSKGGLGGRVPARAAR